MPPKPPYATDEPDTFYETPTPQRRMRQPGPPDPNKRTSAYNVYNNYLGDEKNAINRQSGVGALGMGLMNMDDDDSDDEESNNPGKPASPTTASSKHAALAAATAPPRKISAPTTHAPDIAAPRPGYAAPIAKLNLAQPEPIAVPQGRQGPPQGLRVDTGLKNPFDSPHDPRPSAELPPYSLTTSPSPSLVSSEPHPLQPPITPIMPVFALPAKPGVKFSESDKPIMRGDSEGTVLPRRGERGDDFWRRFSMVAREENRKSASQKESWWLKQTQDGTSRLSRWVWVIGMFLLLCIGAAIGIGWYVSHNSPGHQQPTAFGGSANEHAGPATTSTAVKASGGSTGLHVSPTHTVARRVYQARTTTMPGSHSSRRRWSH